MNPNYQVHHIFPLEAFRDHGEDLARIFGVPVSDVKSVIQSANNRIALFPEPGRAATVKDLHAHKARCHARCCTRYEMLHETGLLKPADTTLSHSPHNNPKAGYLGQPQKFKYLNFILKDDSMHARYPSSQPEQNLRRTTYFSPSRGIARRQGMSFFSTHVPHRERRREEICERFSPQGISLCAVVI